MKKIISLGLLILAIIIVPFLFHSCKREVADQVNVRESKNTNINKAIQEKNQQLA